MHGLGSTPGETRPAFARGVNFGDRKTSFQVGLKFRFTELSRVCIGDVGFQVVGAHTGHRASGFVEIGGVDYINLSLYSSIYLRMTIVHSFNLGVCSPTRSLNNFIICIETEALRIPGSDNRYCWSHHLLRTFRITGLL